MRSGAASSKASYLSHSCSSISFRASLSACRSASREPDSSRSALMREVGIIRSSPKCSRNTRVRYPLRSRAKGNQRTSSAFDFPVGEPGSCYVCSLPTCGPSSLVLLLGSGGLVRPPWFLIARWPTGATGANAAGGNLMQLMQITYQEWAANHRPFLRVELKFFVDGAQKFRWGSARLCCASHSYSSSHTSRRRIARKWRQP